MFIRQRGVLFCDLQKPLCDYVLHGRDCVGPCRAIGAGGARFKLAQPGINGFLGPLADDSLDLAAAFFLHALAR